MTKIVERNLAELIVIGVFVTVFLSSCGLQFGNYERYKQVNRSGMCQEVKKDCCIKTAQEVYEYEGLTMD